MYFAIFAWDKVYRSLYHVNTYTGCLSIDGANKRFTLRGCNFSHGTDEFTIGNLDAIEINKSARVLETFERERPRSLAMQRFPPAYTGAGRRD